MKWRVRTNYDFLIVSFFVILLFFILLPSIFNAPSPDSGTFLYMGQQILDGAVLYRDLWDHKPPMVYFINALGLLIGRGSLQGVVFLEFMMISASLYFVFYILKKCFNRLSAICGLFVFLIEYITYFEGGNFTEEYALFFQFFILYLFLKHKKDQYVGWRGYCMGLFIGFCFLLRQNLIGIGLGIGIYLMVKNIIYKRWNLLFFDVVNLILGSVTILALTLFYFYINASIKGFFDTAFMYNFLYTSSSAITKIRTAMAGCFNYIWMPYVFAGWIAGIYYLTKKIEILNNSVALLFVGVISFPIEIFFCSLQPIRYGHYYMAWIPVTTILVGFLAFILIKFSEEATRQKNATGPFKDSHQFQAVVIILLMLIGLDKSTVLIKELLYKYRHLGTNSKQIVDYIRQTTSEDEYVLMWGNESFAYFLSKRKSPSRYFFQYALFTEKYSDGARANEFIEDIKEHAPVLIIDTHNYKTPPIDPTERHQWFLENDVDGSLQRLSQMLNPFYDYVIKNYRVAGVVDGWTVYQLIKRTNHENH